MPRRRPTGLISPTTQSGYRADIDGLRALAVTAVVLYHAQLGFPGGYTGVDVFFVISGYLIVGVLRRDILAGTFRFGNFWQRRIRRLAPALFFSSVATAAASAWLLLPDDLINLGQALVALPLLAVNIYFWRTVQSGYFGDPPETRPLLHTWSLGVEEQFYLLLPFLMVFLLSRPGLRSHLLSTLAVLSAISLGLCVMLTPTRDVFAFFCLPTRAWEFLWGALAACVAAPSPDRRKTNGLLAWLGLLLVLLPCFLYQEDTPFPGYAAIAPCLGTALMLWANAAKTSVGQAFSAPALVWIGKISYSVYLWHWPVMALASYANVARHPVERAGLALLSYGLGYLSWRWIETPFREKRFFVSTPALLSAFAGQSVALMALGLVLWVGQGLPQRFPADSLRLAQGKNDTSGVYELREQLASGQTVQPRALGAQDQPPSFLLWGDSHAMSLAPMLDRLGAQTGVAGLQLTASSSPPLVSWSFPDKQRSFATEQYKQQWLDHAVGLVKTHSLRTVFLVGYWGQYSQPQLKDQLDQTAAMFRDLGAEVVVVGDVPTQPFIVPRVLATAHRLGRQPPASADPEDHRVKNPGFYAFLDSFEPAPGTRAIDLAPTVLAWPSLANDGHSLYSDVDHLSDHGALLLSPLFTDEIARLR